MNLVKNTNHPAFAQGDLVHASVPLLNALPLPAAMLGPDGRVMALNPAWRALADEGELAAFNLGTGSARTSACDCGNRDGCQLSEAAAEGIVKVIFGGEGAASATASCEASGEPRWFRVDVGALEVGNEQGALIVCAEVTEYKLPWLQMAELVRCHA